MIAFYVIDIYIIGVEFTYICGFGWTSFIPKLKEYIASIC